MARVVVESRPPLKSTTAEGMGWFSSIGGQAGLAGLRKFIGKV
jgi:hypothetical protein